MSQWDLLSELFTVLIEISEDGETRRVSPFVKVRLDSRDQHDFRFFEDFQFKRPARFRGGPLEALATPGRLFLAFSDPLQLAVRGQIIPSDSEAGGGLFVGVPWLAWMSEKYPESEPQFDDFPVHDSQMDQLLLLSTQQKMLEDLQGLNSDLESAKREVEGQGEVRQQFFNRVSHEVRTPLMGVSSALTLLSDKIEDQQALDLLSMAEASMDRATEVINFALGDAEKEGSRAEQFKVATDLRHLGKSLRKLFLATATEKGLTLSVSVSDDIHAQYWCADLLLKEVLINLLGNAIKFTSKGSVHLKVALSKSSAEAVHEVMFQVADSGPGIPEGLRRQVFSPFETGVSAATQGHIGTGLGLSMSEAHVKTMNGAIAVGESESGGALFTVSLPLVPCVNADRVDDSTEPAQTASFDKRLLLLDDSITNLTLNAQLLRSLGFEVTTAMAGGEAIQIAEQSMVPFDVALLDINLPDMTGYEVADRLSALPQCTNTVLVALSAYSQEEEKQKALSSGMLGFITKPFKRDAIATELDYLLGGQAEPAESERLAAKARPLIFDPSQSDEMLSLLGSEVVRGLLDSLSNEGRENLTMLEMAIEQRRHEEGQRAAHTLKSSSKALGLIALSESMASIESQFACGELPRTESLKQAQTAFEEGLAMLREHVSLA
jgi:signal transduction histidine kinase/DNA-binding NarL/FixJ family response regulator